MPGGSSYGGDHQFIHGNTLSYPVGRFISVVSLGTNSGYPRPGLVQPTYSQSTAGAPVVGVGAGAAITYGGQVRVEAGGSFNPNDVLMSDSVGRAVAFVANGTNVPAARAVEGTSTVGQIILVTLLDSPAPSVAIPTVSGGDNGKTLTVSGGAWAAVTPLVAGTSGHLAVTIPGNPTTSITSGGTGSTASVGPGGDFAGILQLYSGSSGGFTTSTVIRVTFAAAYSLAPAVFIQPRDAASNGIWYVSAVTSTYWEIKPNGSVAATISHALSYLAV